MTSAQKVFILSTIMYFVAKGVIAYIFYLVTLRVEKRALEYQKRRQSLLRARRLRNLEMYRRQYQALEERRNRFKVM